MVSPTQFHKHWLSPYYVQHAVVTGAQEAYPQAGDGPTHLQGGQAKSQRNVCAEGVPREGALIPVGGIGNGSLKERLCPLILFEGTLPERGLRIGRRRKGPRSVIWLDNALPHGSSPVVCKSNGFQAVLCRVLKTVMG